MLFNTRQSARCLALQVPTNPDKACRAEADLAACLAARHFHGTIVVGKTELGPEKPVLDSFHLLLVTPTIIRPDTTSPRCSVIRYRLASRLGRVPPSDVCCRQYFYDNRDFIARRRGEEEKGSGKEKCRKSVIGEVVQSRRRPLLGPPPG